MHAGATSPCIFCLGKQYIKNWNFFLTLSFEFDDYLLQEE